MIKPKYSKWITKDRDKAFDIGPTYCKKCGAACVCNRGRYHKFIDYFSFDCPRCGEYTVRDIYKENNEYVVMDMLFD